VLHGSVARGLRSEDYPWGWASDTWDAYLDDIDTGWGTQRVSDDLARNSYASHASDAAFRQAIASFFRAAASPRAALVFERLLRDTDIRDVLPTIQVPVLVTQRLHDPYIDIEEARYIATNIPGARLLELEGADHYPLSGDQEPLMAAIERFLAAAHGAEVDFDRVLATVLFTDLVGSTETAVRVADRAWRDMLAAHHRRVRSLLARFRGREVDVAGDGFLAVFDGPARAVRCGLAIADDARAMGLEVRVGAHTGEVELDGQAVRGIAVHIGARVAAKAGPGEVLVSSTVRDLVVGSGLTFESRGQQELKGVPGAWHLYAASAPEATVGG
jgi:class 3 adenylate cyclase